jgi:uncharacterized protein (TIGR02001 family)
MIKSRVYLAGALLLATAGAAQAGSFTVTPALVSDYDFRGVTQTANGGAVQLGATYTGESGAYVGAWTSNVNFGLGKNDPDAELDLIAGYGFGDATKGFAYDFGVIYYTYINASDFNYPEVYAGVTKGWFNAKLFYSWDWGGNTRPSGVNGSSLYLSTTGTFPLPSDFGFVAHAGYSFAGYWSDTSSEYLDWSVGFTKTLGNFSLGLTYSDGSDLPGAPKNHAFATGGRAILSVSTTLPWMAAK